MRRIDSVVIGAGQAGLGVSRELVERGIEHVVLEQGRIGETWRSQRWDAFALNSPAWMNRLPGDAAPARPDDFPSAPEFAIGLERYAFRHRLPVHESVTVRSLDLGFRGDGLSVAIDAGMPAPSSLSGRRCNRLSTSAVRDGPWANSEAIIAASLPVRGRRLPASERRASRDRVREGAPSHGRR